MRLPSISCSPITRSWATKLLFAIVLVGVGLRVRELLAFRSLWLDEIALILQTKGSSYERIFRSGVGGNQGAPALYLITSRWLLGTIHSMELGARLLPFLAGLGFLLTALGVSRAVFDDNRERVVFLLLCATSPLLIQYSTEGKHYMLETLVASLLLLAFLRYQSGELPHTQMGLLGALSVWCAHCAPVILCAGGIVRIAQELQRKRYKQCLIIVAIAAFWLASFTIHAITNLSGLLSNNALRLYWGHGLAPWKKGPLAVATWSYDVWAHFMRYALLPFQLFHGDEERLSGWTPALSLFLLFVVAAGLIILARRRSAVTPYILALFVTAFCLSLVRIAPFSSRLLLYLTPFVFVCCATTVGACLGHTVIRNILGGTLAVLVVGPSVATSAIQFIKPLDHCNMKGALHALAPSYVAGEPIVLRRPDYQSFAIYARRMKLTNLFVAEKAWRLTPYRAMRDRLVTVTLQSPSKSSWIVSAFGSSDVARGLAELERECCTVQKRIVEDGFMVAQVSLRSDYRPPDRVLKAADK